MRPIEEERMRHLPAKLMRGLKGPHRPSAIFVHQPPQLVAVPGGQALADQAGVETFEL